MSLEASTKKVGKMLEQKKTVRIKLPNGVFLDLREESRGVYKIADFGKNGGSFNAMVLTAEPKKREFKDLENPEHKEWSWAAGDTQHFKYKDMEFDFERGEIRAPSVKAIKEVVNKLEINLVDAADRDY